MLPNQFILSFQIFIVSLRHGNHINTFQVIPLLCSPAIVGYPRICCFPIVYFYEPQAVRFEQFCTIL